MAFYRFPQNDSHNASQGVSASKNGSKNCLLKKLAQFRFKNNRKHLSYEHTQIYVNSIKNEEEESSSIDSSQR